MSLLDDVSIVVTPNGYKAGELYAVVPAASLGNNVIVNGDFATDSDWNKGTGWTISGGSANCDGSQTGATNLTPNVDNVTNNTVYKTTYTISNYVSGSIRIKLGNTGQGQYHSANGTYTEEIKALVTTFPRSQFNADVDFKGSIDNVLVEEVISADMDVTRATAATRVDEAGLVNYAEIIGGEEITNGNFATDSDWTKGTGTTISGGLANLDGSAGAFVSALYQDIPLISGKTYRITFNISNFVSGSLRIRFDQSFTAIGNMTQDGFYEFTKVAASNDDRINFVTNAINTICSIDNVSVKEQSRDNVPRIDYTGGGCPHILAEPQRTNLITYSEDFSQWFKIGSPTLTSDYGVSPDGTQNSTRLQMSTTNKIFATVSASGNISFTVYLKGTGQIRLRDNTSTGLQDVTLTNEWVRYELNFNATISNFQIEQQSGTSDLEIFGTQLEEGSYATSYIPTSGSTVTRNQDQFTRDGISSLINSTEGVLFVEFKTLTETGVFRQFNLSKDNSNRIYITKRGDSGNLEFRMENPSGNLNFSFSENTTNDFVKVAFRYGLNNFAVFIDGVNKNVTATGNVFASGTLNTLEFDSPLGQPFFGKVKQLQVFKTALTDSELATLTTI